MDQETFFKVVDQACVLAEATSSSILLVFVMPKMAEEPEGVAAFEHAEGFPDAFSEYLEELGNRVTNKLSEMIRESRSLLTNNNTFRERSPGNPEHRRGTERVRSRCWC